MILYLDTSSLVKLYVEERGSRQVRDLVRQASAVSTSALAYVEARSAFARKRREGMLHEFDYRRVVKGFHTEWAQFCVVDLSQEIYQNATSLVEKYPLRTLDAIHLGSYLLIKTQISAEVRFSSFDDRLNQIAIQL